jgi:hypothetical protein
MTAVLGFIMLMATQSVHADTDGYIDNWGGNVVFDERSGFTPENTILFNGVIKAPVQLLWESFDLCKELRNELPQTQFFKIDDCVKTMDSELRAKQLRINVVGLKFVAAHNSLTFNIGFDIGSERVRLKNDHSDVRCRRGNNSVGSAINRWWSERSGSGI